MGLAEKRLAQEIRETKLPAFEQKLADIAGYGIAVTLDWDTFTAYDSYPLTRLDMVFNDIASFVKKICADDLGKEALQESMKGIHLTNIENRDDVSMELVEGYLNMKVQLVGSSFSSYTDSQITSFVEAKL